MHYKSTLTLIALISIAGCSTFSKEKKSSSANSNWGISKLWKKEYEQPAKMVAVWTPDTYTVPGQPITRGFGGRIYFYNDRSQAIAVEGELFVYGWEEKSILLGTPKAEADKTFGFTSEQFTEHYSPTDLGASYSVWIPWDEAGGIQKEITIIPVFKMADGRAVQGSPSKLVLEGKSPLDPGFLQAQQVSYKSSTQPTNLLGTLRPENVSKVPMATGTTEIALPGNAGRHFLQNQSATNSATTSTGVTVGGASTPGMPERSASTASVVGKHVYELGTAPIPRNTTVPANSQSPEVPNLKLPSTSPSQSLPATFPNLPSLPTTVPGFGPDGAITS
ncbi:MAG: hypothetical protein KDB03_24250 [Planctomycetales bacterium]|nr:hypothetical protein [Planctomycetales bacterium]